MTRNPAVAAGAVLVLALLGACASSGPRPDAQLARAEASLTQADQAGARQYSAVEFDSARNKLGDAHRLADKGKSNEAGMLADEARVDAELASAHARHQAADKAATEVRLATETLQEESKRRQSGRAYDALNCHFRRPIMKTLPVIALTIAAAVTAACATAPKSSPAVDQAQARIDSVAADPLAREAAATSLDAAQQDLKRAKQALADHEPVPVIDHYAYLANRNGEISAELVGERRARLAVEKGQADRDRVLLEARTREAERAKSDADRAKADADRSKAAADAARGEALSASAESEKLRNELSALQARPTDRGMVLTLGDVLFDTGRSDLKPGALPTVERLAAFMGEHTSTQLLVEGHTDSVGTDEYNVQLSERRADAVRSALLSRGVVTDRVRVKALGKAFPVADNSSAAGRQANRRVEIVFSDDQGRFIGNANGDRAARSGL